MRLAHLVDCPRLHQHHAQVTVCADEKWVRNMQIRNFFVPSSTQIFATYVSTSNRNQQVVETLAIKCVATESSKYDQADHSLLYARDDREPK